MITPTSSSLDLIEHMRAALEAAIRVSEQTGFCVSITYSGCHHAIYALIHRRDAEPVRYLLDTWVQLPASGLCIPDPAARLNALCNQLLAMVPAEAAA